MKILIAADLHWPTINGVATFSRSLAKGLASRGHDVVVIAPSQTGKKYKETDENYTVMRTAALPFPFYQNFRISLTPQREVRRIVEDFQPDVIHLQSTLGIGHAALWAGKKLGIPVVATNHAMPENLIDNLRLLAPFAKPIGYIMKEYSARFHNNADFITLPTEAAINLSFNGGGNGVTMPMKVISNGIDLSRFTPKRVSKALREKYGLPLRKPIITYVGRLDSEKHLPTLMRAFALVAKQVNAHLLIVGGGNEDTVLWELACELKIQHRVTLTGRVPDEDLPALHRVGKVFAMPSPAELQCISMLEAMASGQPVVAVDAGALYELCQDGYNGYLFEVDDSEQMARKMTTILKDPALRRNMSQHSLEIAKKHDMAHTLKQFEAVYDTLVAGKDDTTPHEQKT